MDEIVYTDRGDIDWSQPQPYGTWRCDRGYAVGTDQCGCLERATTDVQSEDIDSGKVFAEHLCTQHALIAQLATIGHALTQQTEATAQQTETLAQELTALTENVWDISWTLRPFWRRWFSGIRESLYYRRKQRREARRSKIYAAQKDAYVHGLNTKVTEPRYAEDLSPEAFRAFLDAGGGASTQPEQDRTHIGVNYHVQAESIHDTSELGGTELDHRTNQ
jgi:hypothetical protein